QSRAEKTHAVMTKCLRWVAIFLVAALVLLLVGNIIIVSLGRRYRDVLVFVMCYIFTGLCVVLPLYLAFYRSSDLPEVLWRGAILLLLSALIWFFIAFHFFMSYGRETQNSGWYAPADKIIFSNGFLVRTHIRVYEPGNCLWTGPMLPQYEYIN
ncbi:MAG: hypothetical protein FWD25_13870, partial [Clostridia bacterium]|nr:hypothetical protein [Clostridia bacterium]